MTCVTRSLSRRYSPGTGAVQMSSVICRFFQPSLDTAMSKTLTGTYRPRPSCWVLRVNGSKHDGGVHNEFSEFSGIA